MSQQIQSNHQYNKDPLADKTQSQLEYEQFLQSPFWQELKHKVRECYKSCLYPLCERSNLETAHIQYMERGTERVEDLLLLCGQHHRIFDHDPEAFQLQWVLARQQQRLEEYIESS